MKTNASAMLEEPEKKRIMFVSSTCVLSDGKYAIENEQFIKI